MATPEIAISHEVGQSMPMADVYTPSRNRFSRLVMAFWALATLSSGCNSSSESSGTTTTDESGTVLDTTTTIDVTQITEPTPTTTLHIATPDKADAANCKLFGIGGERTADFLEELDPPATPELIFYGFCDGFSKWGWGYQGKPTDKYTIDYDLTGAEYDKHGYYDGPLDIDSAGIDWDAKHPAYPEAVTLLEIAEAPPGTPVCVHQGRNPDKVLRMTTEKIAMEADFNEHLAEPDLYPVVYLRHPSGAGEYYSAPFWGVSPIEQYGAWTVNFVEFNSGNC